MDYSIHLRQGCELYWAERHIRIASVSQADRELECVKSKKRWTESVEKLEIQMWVGRLVPRAGLDRLDSHGTRISIDEVKVLSKSDAAKMRMLQIADVINALRAEGITNFTPTPEFKLKLDETAARMELDLSRLGPWTIYRHFNEYKRNGYQFSAWLPDYENRGVRRADVPGEDAADIRLHPETAELLLLDLELRKQPNSEASLRYGDVFDDHRTKIRQLNETRSPETQLPTACRSTVRRWVDDRFTAFERDVREIGTEAAIRKHRQTGARAPVKNILECMQCDDVDTRVYVVDPDTGRPFGTMTGTLCVDAASDALQGAGFTANSVNTELELTAFLNAIYPKDRTASNLASCKRPWVMHGMPGFAIFDNASYNHSEIFKLTLIHHGIDWAYARPHTPTDKDSVERVNGRFKDKFCRRQPGAAVTKNSREECAKGMREAVLTPQAFEREAMAWLVDTLMHEPGANGKSPTAFWEEQRQLVDAMMPNPLYSFFAAYWMVEHVRLNRASGGFIRRQLRYQSDDLARLQRYIGNRKVVARVNPSDLRYVYVLDRIQKVWLLVPCIDADRHVFALTNWQLTLLQRSVDRARYGHHAGASWMRSATADLLEKSRILCASNSIKDRQKGYVLKTAFAAPDLALASPTAANPATPQDSVSSQIYVPPTAISVPPVPPRSTLEDLWNSLP